MVIQDQHTARTSNTHNYLVVAIERFMLPIRAEFHPSPFLSRSETSINSVIYEHYALINHKTHSYHTAHLYRSTTTKSMSISKLFRDISLLLDLYHYDHSITMIIVSL